MGLLSKIKSSEHDSPRLESPSSTKRPHPISVEDGNKRRSLNHSYDPQLAKDPLFINEGQLTLAHLLPAKTQSTVSSSSDYETSYGRVAPVVKGKTIPDLQVQEATPSLGTTSPRVTGPSKLGSDLMQRSVSSSSALSDSSDQSDSKPMSRSRSTSMASYTSKNTTPTAPDMRRQHSGGSATSRRQNSTRIELPAIPALPMLSPTKSRSGTNKGIAGALAMSGVAIAAAGSAQTSMKPTAFTQPRSRAPSFEQSDDSQEARADFIGRMPSFDESINDVSSAFFEDGFVGTGYAVASSKRNQDFHALFEAVGEDDFLIEDYGCALQKEILVQGRLYISEHHLCFNANIFGWVTHLAIPFGEVVSIEKRMTAYVIPNAIQVATLHARYTFASFLSRDTTYELMTNIWRINHPHVPPGAALPDHEDFETDGTDDLNGEDDADLTVSRRRRKGFRSKSKSTPAGNAEDVGPILTAEPSSMIEFKKGAHRVTQVPSSVTQLSNVCMDEVFSSSPEKIYNLMFVSQAFIKDFWIVNQKLTELQVSDWSPGANNLLQRTYSYIKPLTGSIGPKSMKCYLTDENEIVDFDDHVVILTTTKTPDAPSGAAFAVKTRTCITWARNNKCRVRITTAVDWTKSSFLKGVITASAIDGQLTYHKELSKEIKVYIQQHKSEFQHDQSGAEIDDEHVEESNVQENQTAAAADAEQAESSDVLARYLGPNIADPIRQAVSVFREAGSSALSIATSNPMVTGIILVLIFLNLWTLRSSRRLPPRLSPNLHGADRNPEEVAAAVRNALSDYFGVNSKPVIKTGADETADISIEIDRLEERIRRLRSELHSIHDPV